MSINQQNKEEEVDLGSLFVIIGNGFKKFFQFIGKIFTGIFHFCIQILLFIKENIIKLGISAMVGAAFGGYLEIESETIYGSDMILEPNFKSSKQLYSNINYYNELVGQKEFQQLETLFEIDSVLASSIVSFEKASPEYSITKPVPPAVPISPIIFKMMSKRNGQDHLNAIENLYS